MWHMAQAHKLGATGLVFIAAICSIEIAAQVDDPATLVQEKLVSQIKLTKVAAAPLSC